MAEPISPVSDTGISTSTVPPTDLAVSDSPPPPAGQAAPAATMTSTTPPVAESAATRKFASAGWEGLFKVSTRLLGEKEIDIDDREANLLFTLEMKTIEPWEFKFLNLHVVLRVTSTDPNQNISINGLSQGPLILFDRADGHELFPGAALNTQLTVKTGAFSSDRFNADSALAGLKNYHIDIEYDVMPLVGEARNTTYTQLVFYIAND